jgi:hypothetical protein
MGIAGDGDRLEILCVRIRESIAHYAGRVEYGNLRSHISQFDCGEGDPVTNVALVYETPGGSTDQINIEFNHVTGHFAVIDAHEGEIKTHSIEDVMDRIKPRIVGIPQKRLETLHAEIRRHIDDGGNHAGLFGHLNRILQSEFKGGGITHIELRDAMTFAVHYMKSRGAG